MNVVSSRKANITFLKKHFPEATPEQLSRSVKGLDIRLDIAKSWNLAESRQKSERTDMKALQDAVKKLKKAEATIREVGLWGGKLIVETAKELDALDTDVWDEYSPTASAAPTIVANSIANIHKRISESIRSGTQDSGGASAKEGRTGAPKKTEALQVGLALGEAFHVLTGKRPTVSTDRDTNKKHGRFLGLVTDFFVLNGIMASPEYIAEKVCKERKRQTS